MTRFHKMAYYNIHTHYPTTHPEDISIINILIRGGESYHLEDGQNYSAGIHPWYINNIRQQLDELERLCTHPDIVAIGEAGFDKIRGGTPDVQQEAFQTQALLAEKVNKPLIIHCVKAYDEIIKNKKVIKPQVPWIIHGFRGNGKQAEQLLRQGFYLSFGQYFNPKALKVVYPDYLFAETDDADIDIRSVYQQITENLSYPVEETISSLTLNIKKVFPGL